METTPIYEVGIGQDGIQALQGVLSAYFPVAVHEFKPQATSGDKKSALCPAYIDSRHYQDRLDKVDPSWSVSYEIYITTQKLVIIATVTVLGRSRSSTGDCELGDKNTATSAEAQAFKRACSAHGLGRYLYHLPKWWADYDAQKKRLTPQGVSDLKQKLARELGETAPRPVKRPTGAATDQPGSTPTSGTSASVVPTGAATEGQPATQEFTPTAFWSVANTLIGPRFADRAAVQAIVAANTGTDGVTDWMRAVAGLA